MAFMADGEGNGVQHSPAGPDQGRTSGLVLLLEDDSIISMALEEDLQDAGYKVEPFMTCKLALDWLHQHTPDVAVLDVNLGAGTCLQVAQRLEEQGVPFLIATGHHPDKRLLRGVRDVPWMQKPCDTTELLLVIAKLIGTHVKPN